MYNFILVTMLGVGLAGAEQGPVFSNPVSWAFSQYSPTQNTVIRLGNFYYMTSVNIEGDILTGLNSTLVIRKSPVLTSFDNETYSVAFKAPPNRLLSGGILHELNGSLYLYFTIFQDIFGYHLSTYYMEAINATDPMGGWTPPRPLFEFDQGHNLMDGTVMKHNGQLYWIGTEYVNEFMSQYPYSIYIYPMESPTQIVENGTLLRRPTENWECFGDLSWDCGLQSPFVITNKGVNYMVFSAVGLGENSSLSYISISADQNPMNISEWSSAPGPVFTSNLEEDMLRVRAASFTMSPDGTEMWMLFHSSTKESGYSGPKLPSIEKIGWNNLTGEPEFPSAHGFGHMQPVPSGQLQ